MKFIEVFVRILKINLDKLKIKFKKPIFLGFDTSAKNFVLKSSKPTSKCTQN